MTDQDNSQPTATKKAWVTPQLVVHGDVARITGLTNKNYGPTDGFTFQGVPISTVQGS